MISKKNYHFAATVTASLLLVLHSTNLSAQELWSFDGVTKLKSNSSESTLQYQSVRGIPEFSDGIVGLGLRTDGYSTQLKGRINQAESIGLSGWFALESYPTDTAAFFGMRDSLSSRSIALCVDRFGDILIGYGDGNGFDYLATNQSIERFQWVNLALSSVEGSVSAWLNGQTIVFDSKLIQPVERINEFILARDFRTKKQGPQDLTTINGLIDEFKLWSGEVDVNSLLLDSKTYGNAVPKLAIPASRFKDDFSRPKYHVLPAANWTNETHGLIYYKNRYHIFNQKNASNLNLRQINWGHFSSPDLVNWTEHIPALTPQKGYDQNGIWSGHAVLNDEGIPTIIYTVGGDQMGVGIAFPADPNDPNLVTWTKYEGNPVILGQPDGFTRVDLRDPYVWKEGDKWYLIIGFGIAEDGEQRGTVLLYSSDDLKKWTFIHPLFEGNPAVDNSGIFWEMPVFKKIAGKYVLLVNKVPHNRVPARAMYWVGDFKNEKFVPDDPTPRNLEVINRLLSPSVAEDENGLITAIAIIPDEIGGRAAYEHGWTHLYSIPRVWHLSDGKIEQTPHPNLKTLRGAHNHIASTVRPNESVKISEGHQQLEAKITIIPGEATKFGFTIHKNQDGTEFTKIYYDAENQEMVVDQTHSSLKENIPLRERKDTYSLDTSKPVDFHLFIDGSVVEVFVNNKDAFTTRIFPLKASSNQLEAFSEGSAITVDADVWILNNANMQTDF